VERNQFLQANAEINKKKMPICMYVYWYCMESKLPLQCSWCYPGNYCEIIYIRWTFNFVYFVGIAIHKFKTPTKYLFILVILHIQLEIHEFKCVHEHVQCCQTTKYCANEIKWFHSVKGLKSYNMCTKII